MTENKTKPTPTRRLSAKGGWLMRIRGLHAPDGA